MARHFTPRDEEVVSLSEFVRTVSNKATRTRAEGTRVSYYNGRRLIGYNVEFSRRPGSGMGVKCVRIA
jgi:hypothetical protein